MVTALSPCFPFSCQYLTERKRSREHASGSPFIRGDWINPRYKKWDAGFSFFHSAFITKRRGKLLASDCLIAKMEGYRRPRPGSAVPGPPSSTVSSAAPSLSTSRESMDIICQLSDLLQTGLSRDALVALVDLLESGVSPEAVAAAITEIRREVVGGGVGGRA